MMYTVCLSLLVAGLMTGCGNQKNEESAAPAATSASNKPAPSEKVAAKPADAVKAEYKPDELWKVVDEMSRLDRMQKFAKGVTVTGTVKGIKDDPLAEYAVDLDASNNHVVELRFNDFGKAAKAKKLKVGDAVSAKGCTITNPQGDMMALVQCQIQ